MSWTEERIEVLSRLWLEGKSASQISVALGAGLTRNAVIGKVHRLGLAGRVKPNGVAIPVSNEREEVYEAPRSASASRRSVPRSASIASTVAVAAATMSMGATARAVHGNTALAVAEAVVEAPKPVRLPEEVVVPLSLRVTIVELRESMCKWPLGDPSSAEFRYCGSQIHVGTPYCPYHGKLAYQPVQDRRRERERERRPLLAR